MGAMTWPVDPQPGEHFSWSEMTRTSTKLLNVPGEAQVRGLITLCTLVLDPLREHLGRPVQVISAYRSPAVNARVGGASGSVHVDGLAADLKVAGMSAAELARAVLASGVPFDQLIWYAPERGGHIHVGLRTGKPLRCAVMHAPAGSKGYILRAP